MRAAYYGRQVIRERTRKGRLQIVRANPFSWGAVGLQRRSASRKGHTAMATQRMEYALWRFIIPAMAAALLTFVLLLAFAPPAEANYNGCRYDPDSIDPISYDFFGVETQVRRAVNQGDDGWDGTTAPGYFKHDRYDLDPEIEVKDYASMATWAGEMRGTCLSSGLWKGNEVKITFNNTQMRRFNDYQRKVIAMHELGHAYGLSHVTTYCRLMKQGAEKFTCGTMPDSSAVSLVTALYP